MPYCPKCGVEVDYKLQIVPYVLFPSLISQTKIIILKLANSRPENKYYETILKIKIRFFTLSILIFVQF